MSHAAEEDGVALRRILAVEVGRRWSEEARNFLSQLARVCARGEFPLLRKRAEQAWRLRWGLMLSHHFRVFSTPTVFRRPHLCRKASS